MGRDVNPNVSILKYSRPHTRSVGSWFALACATVLAVTIGLGPSAASARPWGAHDKTLSTTGPSPEEAHALAPLTLANFVITSPTGDSTTHSGPVSIAFGGIHTWQFLTLGYQFNFADNAQTLAPGQYDTLTDAQAGVANDQVCMVNGDGGFEIDQANYNNAGALTVAAIQFDFVCPDGSEFAGTIAYNIVPTDPTDGYYLFGQQGEITGFGNDNYLSYLNGAQYYNLNAPIVGMAPTPDGGGYWMVGSDGGVFSSGDAGFFGSTGSIHLNQPVVGMVATPDAGGYWFVASDGGIFAYGDAGFYGSRGGHRLNKPIVGMAATPDGKGYWLVASDGGIFSYGDAGFYGSRGGQPLNKPIVGMAATPDGKGYWLVASDGGIFSYGDASFYGSNGAIHLNAPIVGMTATPDGTGYWFTASDGGVFNYGSAGFAGSLGGSGVADVAGMSRGASQPVG